MGGRELYIFIYMYNMYILKLYLGFIRREKSHHPHGTAATQKSHICNWRLSYKVAKALRTAIILKRHRILLAWVYNDILYWCPALRDQIKPVLVQPRFFGSANGLVVDSCSRS